HCAFTSGGAEPQVRITPLSWTIPQVSAPRWQTGSLISGRVVHWLTCHHVFATSEMRPFPGLSVPNASLTFWQVAFELDTAAQLSCPQRSWTCLGAKPQPPPTPMPYLSAIPWQLGERRGPYAERAPITSSALRRDMEEQ